MKKQAKKSKIHPFAPGGVKLMTDYLNKIDGLISSSDQREMLKRRFEMLIETGNVTENDPAMIKAMQILRQLNPDEKALAERGIRVSVEGIAHERMKNDPEGQRISEEIRRLEKDKYELEDDEYYPIDEMPDDLRQLNDQWDRRNREIEADILREHGEHELADMYLDDEAYKADLAERMKELNERLQEMKPGEPTDLQKMPLKTRMDIVTDATDRDEVTDSHGITEQA